MDTPSSLLQRLRQSPGPADWTQFVQLYTPLLVHWARQANLQDADAADLVQEVLALLFRKLPEFAYDRDRSFRSWLRTVTLNKWREIRRRRAPVTVDNEALLETPGEDPMRTFEEVEYRQHLVGNALKVLREEFPDSTWQAFQKYVMERQPVEKVAAELGIRAGTVYAAKSRVLSRLRLELEGLLD
jgi:RNA polymerase sigma-70 factor (ECF subfamily)